MMRWLAVFVAVFGGIASAQDRPTMRQLPGTGTLPQPPSQRDLVDARAELKARFREPLSHTETAAGARLAAETLLAAAVDEPDRSLKWLMLDEARRLGAAAGSADTVTRAITLSSAIYDFDELDLEFRSLTEIPLRALDPMRATLLAEAAEKLAARADTDGRTDMATAARLLAVKAWQRSGNTAAARRLLGQ